MHPFAALFAPGFDHFGGHVVGNQRRFENIAAAFQMGIAGQDDFLFGGQVVGVIGVAFNELAFVIQFLKSGRAAGEHRAGELAVFDIHHGLAAGGLEAALNDDDIAGVGAGAVFVVGDFLVGGHINRLLAVGLGCVADRGVNQHGGEEEGGKQRNAGGHSKGHGESPGAARGGLYRSTTRDWVSSWLR